MKYCLACQKPLLNYQGKYCSNVCQANLRYVQFIKLWKSGNTNGTIGLNAKNISGHIRRYLIEKYENKCSICGWSKINPITGKVPVEVDHINGNADDNNENNLRLICPNSKKSTLITYLKFFQASSISRATGPASALPSPAASSITVKIISGFSPG